MYKEVAPDADNIPRSKLIIILISCVAISFFIRIYKSLFVYLYTTHRHISNFVYIPPNLTIMIFI